MTRVTFPPCLEVGKKGSRVHHTSHVVYIAIGAPPPLSLCLLGSLPTLAKCQTVTCLTSHIFCQKGNHGEARSLWYTHFLFPAIRVFVFFSLSVSLSHYSTKLMCFRDPWSLWDGKQMTSGPEKERASCCHGDVMSWLVMSAKGFWGAVTCYFCLFMGSAQKSTDD